MADWFGVMISTVISWVSANAVWIGTISFLYFLVSLFAVRYLIVRIPARYFSQNHVTLIPLRHPVAAAGLKIGKNLCGIIVILIGLVMSIPGVAGQGFITILLGLFLTDFPGKRKLELRLIRLPLVFRMISSIREKSGVPPLELPPDNIVKTGSGTTTIDDR